MTPDPPFTATQIYLQRRSWVSGLVLLVLVLLALVGAYALLFGAGGPR